MSGGGIALSLRRTRVCLASIEAEAGEASFAIVV